MGKHHKKLLNSLKQIRKSKGLTQQELSNSAEVSRKSINAIENGVYVPSTVLALKIANSKFNQPKKKTSESYKLYQNFYTSLEQVEVIVEEMKVCYELMLEELNIDNGEPVRLSKSTLFEIYLRQQPDLQVVK